MFQSTLPARGSDGGWAADAVALNEFQSTLPARGSDISRARQIFVSVVFQSTLPARRSDSRGTKSFWPRWSFNPRSPRGGATAAAHLGDHLVHVSIHAPREGERRWTRRRLSTSPMFQSTLPARGSDQLPSAQAQTLYQFQSTLPARGSDSPLAAARFSPRGFNPRSPRGRATAISCASSTTT